MPNLDERQWVDLFMNRLQQLTRITAPDEAVAHAHERYNELGDADPGQAAETYAKGLQPRQSPFD
jgi:hypothetical protein